MRPISGALIGVVILASACGRKSGGSVTADPAVLDFGAEPIGSRIEGELQLIGFGRVKFGAAGRITGSDAASFGVSGDEPTDIWPRSRVGQMHLFFAPTKEGPVSATYIRPMASGTITPVTVKGIGSYEFDVGTEILHVGHYPTGMDFGAICVNDSVKKVFQVTNNTPRDRLLQFMWERGDPAFMISQGTPLQPSKAHETIGWRIAFRPKREGEITAGVVVQFPEHHEKRTILVVRGRGKPC